MVCFRSVRRTPPTRSFENERDMQTEEFARASNIIVWNRRFLLVLGIWPQKVNQFLFVLFTVYTANHVVMAFNHLFVYFSQPKLIVGNLTETVLFVMIFGKILILRKGCGVMAKFLRDIENDFSINSYRNDREKTAYLHYNELALTFIKVSMSLTTFTATLYYLKVYLINWNTITSGNFSYELPYQVHPFFEIKDTSTYTYFCIYLAINLIVIPCAYAGPDAFVLCMVLHVCGQFATLSCRISDLLMDHDNYHHHVSNIVLRHHHLIRLAEMLENNFNMIFLQEALGTVFLLCLTMYHIITNSEGGDDTSTIVFMLYTLCILSTNLVYCYIGECLITESTGLRDTFYNSDWYNNSWRHTKLISICMTRAEKPLILSAGKFCALSLTMFTSIIKTSMAYLSMLRNFV